MSGVTLHYLNLDLDSHAKCGDFFSLLDEEKVKYFVEDVRGRRYFLLVAGQWAK